MADITKEIARLEREITQLERGLPYADGKAWHQDKARISNLQGEVRYLKTLKENAA